MTNHCDIIDLTDSFTLADHCALSNVIINLDTDDDSMITDDTRFTSETSTRKVIQNVCSQVTKKSKTKMSKSRLRKSDTVDEKKSIEQKESNIGDCPICWDTLGKNPLASTKCGHVYCIKCLEQYLKLSQKCPTCRKPLKGHSAYHPLYL